MKKLGLLLIAVLLIAGMDSCRSKKAAKRKQAEAAAEADRRAKDSIAAIMLNATLLNDMPGADKYHLVVSFYSVGSGTDGATHKAFKEFVAPYDSSGQLTAERYNWGREGETDYCIRILNMPADKQIEFLVKAKAILNKSDRVHVEENADCKHKK